jgi:peptide/nickel transport system permease protein
MSERAVAPAVSLPHPRARQIRGPGERAPSGGPWAGALRRLRSDPLAVSAAVMLALIAGLAVGAPAIAPRDPIAIDARQTLRPPSAAQPFGTDYLGRDVLSRVVYGGRLSLPVGLISAGISLACGLALGLVAGFSGGWRDMLIIRAMDVLLACPVVLLALAILAVLGPSLSNVTLAVALSHVPQYARVVRSSVLSTTTRPYVHAARALGCADVRLMLGHVLPNGLTPVIPVATLGVATAITLAAGLSFLGLGAQPPTPEWGAMVGQGREYLRTGWWVSTAPGLMILVTVLAINLLGDGLRRALDPTAAPGSTARGCAGPGGTAR